MVQKATSSAVDTYVSQTILLTRSIVFKSNISAQRLNKAIIDAHGEEAVNDAAPQTWRYYMNIAGKYHFTDTLMQVISLDTQQLIDFTVENMLIHTATAEAYRYGTRYYYALVKRFPSQEQLIMAINSPADLDKAIAAKDGDLLSFYKDLIEPQEYTLAHDIEQYIKLYLQRYTVVGFDNVWDTYPVINYAILYQSLVSQIMNLRLEAIKTERTHSFHITQYLASHGKLDRFMPYMTLKQKLYLYHNIDMIEKFAGHTQTFEELIKWILDDRYIPLSSYTVRQLQSHNDQLYPDLRARRSAIGSEYNAAEAEYIPIDSLYDKEALIQKGSKDYFKLHVDRISHDLATDDTSVIQTKDLESAMVDYTDAVPTTLPEVLLRQWAYMSATGLYNVLTNFIHPMTGERVSMVAKDALIYYSYVFMAGIGAAPVNVPEFVNVKYRLHPRPPATLLYRDLVKNDFHGLKALADDLVSAQPNIVECFSTSAFFNLSYKIFEEVQRHWYITASKGDPMERGIAAKMISRLFGITCLQQAPPGTNMKTWLLERSLPVFEGTYHESLTLCNTIFQSATGYAVDETKSLRSIQKAMIEMFKQLSSYTIQIMREINDSAVIPVNWAAIRIGTKGQEGEDDIKIPVPVRVIDYVGELAENTTILAGGDLIKTDTDIMPQFVNLKSDVKVRLCEGTENTILTHGISIPVIRVFEDPTPSKANAYKPFLPNVYYEALTPEQILEIAKATSLISMR